MLLTWKHKKMATKAFNGSWAQCGGLKKIKTGCKLARFHLPDLLIRPSFFSFLSSIAISLLKRLVNVRWELSSPSMASYFFIETLSVSAAVCERKPFWRKPSWRSASLSLHLSLCIKKQQNFSGSASATQSLYFTTSRCCVFITAFICPRCIFYD